MICEASSTLTLIYKFVFDQESWYAGGRRVEIAPAVHPRSSGGVWGGPWSLPGTDPLLSTIQGSHAISKPRGRNGNTGKRGSDLAGYWGVINVTFFL